MKSFPEEPELEIINGRFGPYMVYKGENYRLPKSQQERVAELTCEECLQMIKEQEEKAKAGGGSKRRYTRKKS